MWGDGVVVVRELDAWIYEAERVNVWIQEEAGGMRRVGLLWEEGSWGWRAYASSLRALVLGWVADAWDHYKSLPFTEHVLHAGHCLRSFTCFNSLNLLRNPRSSLV